MGSIIQLIVPLEELQGSTTQVGETFEGTQQISLLWSRETKYYCLIKTTVAI